jgi:DNA-binding transcriptional MocR family regulator
MAFQLAPEQLAGEAPVYQQIAGAIRAQMESGALARGERLPTIRALAERLDVNRDTVAAAYEALAAEGLVDARVGRGTFVRGPRPRARVAEPVALPLSRHAERLLDLERARVAYGAGRGALPLHALKPDPRHFPLDAFRRSLLRVLQEGGAELLNYGDPQGLLALREVVAERLRAQGVLVGPESIVLCQGASQGIALSLRLFADADSAIAVEEPTYQNALGAIAAFGMRPVPVPMRDEGADLDALDRALARPEVRAFYTIPTFHNPMGVTTDVTHRRRVLEIAARHGKAVIEDAYEMDLRYAGRLVPTLAGLDEEGLVVQLLSFSKSLFPGVRAGAVVARGRHIDALLALRHAADLGGAPPLQAALADFVRSGAYDRHLSAQRRRLRARRDALLESLAAELPEGARWITPEGGLQLWLELPEPLDSREIHADALREGVLVAPGFPFLTDGRPSRGLRLSIGLCDEAELREAVRRLGKVVRERLAAEPAPGGRASIQV